MFKNLCQFIKLPQIKRYEYDQSFGFNKALKDLQADKDLNGKEGILTPLIKQLTEVAFKAGLEHHLEQAEEPNRKNGSTKKTIKTGNGNFELDIPRDRAGTFEPQLIKKNQTQLTPELDRKILSLFSHGISYRDIQKHVEDMYGIEVSTGTLSAVTDQLL